MKLQNPYQIKEFFNLPSEIDSQCSFCDKTAIYIVLSIRGFEVVLCNQCFESMMAIESMLKTEN